MLYDVSQLAELTNVSKVTIYSKLKLKALKPYIVKKQGKTYVDEEGFNLIKQSLNAKEPLNEALNDDEQVIEEIALDMESEEVKTLNRELINTLKSEVEFLKGEIENKNKQLDSKDKLLENMQVLLKQQEDKKLLEEHFKDIDNKLVELRSELNNRSSTKTSSKLFRFFNKKK